MKTTVLRACFVMLVIVSCKNNKGGHAIVYEETTSPKALLSLVERIDLIPLQTKNAPLLGSRIELFPMNDSYIVSDMENSQVFRYSREGHFLNSIGTRGNGPGEYINIHNVQTTAERVIVFSAPDKVLHYDLEGRLCHEIHMKELGTQSWVVPEGLLAYYSFGSGRGHRAGLWEEDVEIPYLEDDINVIHFSAGAPVFSEWGGRTYFTDAYTPTVMVYSNKTVAPQITVDFKNAAIPEEFYEFDDPFAAMEFLLKRRFALIQRYYTNDRYQFLEVFVQDKDKMEAKYGIARDGEWNWFYLGKVGTSPLAGSFRSIDNRALYCLIDPYLIRDIDSSFGALISNPDIIEHISTNDNPVLAILVLK